MTENKPKSTPAERLAKQLKSQGNSVSEVKRFRRKLRAIVPLCKYPRDIAEWIYQRFELGLITEPSVVRCANEIVRLIELVEERAVVQQQPKKSTLDAEERLKLINEREQRARESVPFVGYKVTLSAAARMASAYDRLVGIDFASRDG